MTEGARSPARAVLLRASERAAVPWRNGGGVTTVVASAGAGAGAGAGGAAADFDWRVSIATISQSGAFSSFPGVDRVLMPLSPAGLTLDVGGRIRHLTQNEAISFAGEETVAAIDVASPGDDLNLMTRRGVCTGTVEVRELDGSVLFEAEVQADADVTVVVLVIRGDIVWAEDALLGRDAVLLPQGTTARLAGRGAVAVVTVTRA